MKPHEKLILRAVRELLSIYRSPVVREELVEEIDDLLNPKKQEKPYKKSFKKEED